MCDPKAVFDKYFPDGAPELWKQKFHGADKEKALQLFANVRTSEDIKKIVEDNFGGEVPKELSFFDGKVPDDLIEALRTVAQMKMQQK